MEKQERENVTAAGYQVTKKCTKKKEQKERLKYDRRKCLKGSEGKNKSMDREVKEGHTWIYCESCLRQVHI